MRLYVIVCSPQDPHGHGGTALAKAGDEIHFAAFRSVRFCAPLRINLSRLPCAQMADDADMSDFLLTLEDRFYAQGMEGGTAHGELHGVFEGRALGREKGWELWEEVGYYEGVATFWRAILTAQGKPGR